MKVFGCLLAVAVAAQAIDTSKLRAQKGQQFSYRTISLSGIPLVSNDRTGLALWTTVNFYYDLNHKVVLKLDSPVVRQVDLKSSEDVISIGQVPEVEEADNTDRFVKLPEDIETLLLIHLQKPISFTYTNGGLVVDILAMDGEPEFVLNIKRGILNQIQNQGLNKPSQIFTEDTTLGKDCEVKYDVIGMNITKTWSVEKCRVPAVFRDAIGIQGVLVDRDNDVMKASVVSKLEVREISGTLLPATIITEGRFTLRPFSPEEGEMITYTRQELIYVQEIDTTTTTYSWTTDYDTKIRTKRSSSLYSPLQSRDVATTDVYEDILSEDKKIELIVDLLNRILKTVESETEPTFELESAHEFIYATKLMRTLRQDTSFTVLVDTAIKTKGMRRLMISALSFTGSPALVKALPQIKSRVTAEEFNTIVTALPLSLIPTEQSIRTLKTLYTDEESWDLRTKQQLLLVLGSEIHDFCKVYQEGQLHPIQYCSPIFRTELREFFQQEYSRVTEDHKLLVLKAIGNSGLNMVDFLNIIIRTKSLRTDLRVNAIYALRRVVKVTEVEKVLLPVYLNELNLYTDAELRIAAFNILIDLVPTEVMLTRLVSYLNEATDLQLGNYVYSYVNNLIELPLIFTPTRNLTVAAQTLLPTIRRYEDGFWYSTNIQYIITSISQRFAKFLETNLVNVQNQALPRSMNLRLVKSFSGYYMNLLEMGFRLEGLDTLAKEFLDKIFAHIDDYTTTTATATPFGAKIKKEMITLKRMLTDEIVPRTVEETRGYFFIESLGNELGVYTLKDLHAYYTTDMTTDLMLGAYQIMQSSVRYFTIVPMVQAEIKIQTPVGIPVVADWSAISMLSLRSAALPTKTYHNDLFTTAFTTRLLVKSFGRIGLDLGYIKPTVGQCMHLKLQAPLIVRLGDDYQVEVYINTQDILYTSEVQDNKRLLEVSNKPWKFLEYVTIRKTTYVTKMTQVEIHPLLLTHTYKTDYEGLRYSVQTVNHKDLTIKRPLYPFSGREELVIEFTDIIKPVGVLFNLDYDFTKTTEKFLVDLTLTLNKQIKEITRTLKISTIIDLITGPHLTIKLTPDTKKTETFNFYSTFELLSGKVNSYFNWIAAGEDMKELIKVLTQIQFGWDVTYDLTKQDIILKSEIKKSDLQKYLERVDAQYENSTCSICEQLIEQDVYTNIFCERCVQRRSWLSHITHEGFINPKKNYYTELWMPTLIYYFYPYYDTLESLRLWTEEDLHTILVTKEKDAITSYMTHIETDDIISFRTTHEIHPYFTEYNVTYEAGKMLLKFTHLPLVPAYRRIYNLPLYRLTDEATYRVAPWFFEDAGCVLDSGNFAKTFDDYFYNLPVVTETEQLLVKDCTTDKTFEITTLLTKEKLRVVLIKLVEGSVEIIQTTDSKKYIVKVNKAEKTWVDDVIETEHVLATKQTIDTPTGTDQTLDLYLRTLDIHVYMLDNLVHVETPFYYKNQVCGLCGDFNGEQSNELVLPNKTHTTTLQTFIDAYTTKTTTTNTFYATLTNTIGRKTITY